MPNGNKGDHPITDIVFWKTPRFSPSVDTLIAEIVKLGGEKELERTFNLFQPSPLDDFEGTLKSMRDRLWKEAKEGGWEV
jgi:hypothetical protein